MILVAGGTGRLGSLVVKGLAAQGAEVRVLTRNRQRAEQFTGIVADVMKGDVREPGTLAAAFSGIDTVVSAVHGFAGPGRVSPRSVDRDGNANLFSAAAHARCDVVMVSVVGASPDSPMELFRCKHAAEQHLQASGLPWTIVRAAAFVELWADILSKGIVFGKGDNPINFVSVRDVAATVEQAVLDSGLRGQILEVAGPQNITLNQLAVLVRNAQGRPRRVHHIPRWMLRAMAPLHRQPRAALTLDTANMTYQPCPRGSVFGADIREALEQAAMPNGALQDEAPG